VDDFVCSRLVSVGGQKLGGFGRLERIPELAHIIPDNKESVNGVSMEQGRHETVLTEST